MDAELLVRVKDLDVCCGMYGLLNRQFHDSAVGQINSLPPELIGDFWPRTVLIKEAAIGCYQQVRETIDQ